MIDIDADGIKALKSGKLSDEINSDMILGSGWHSLWLQSSIWVLCRLVALALVATEYILLYRSCQFGLPVVSQDELECAVFARVSGRRHIVASLDDIGPELFCCWGCIICLCSIEVH